MRSQKGFALIVSMLVLILLTIVVLAAVRSNQLNERMAGGYMDRTLAFQAAEQALQEGRALLVANSATCFDSTLGCSIVPASAGAASATVTSLPGGTVLGSMNPLPTTWDSSKAVAVNLASGQKSTGAFTVTRLSGTSMPVSGGGTVSDCKAYSILGRGVGMDATTVVLLQAVVWMCGI